MLRRDCEMVRLSFPFHAGLALIGEPGEELAFQSSVIELSALVGLDTEGFFEGWVGGDGTQAPARMACHQIMEMGIDLFAGFAVAETLTVGRIADKDSLRTVQLEGFERFNMQINHPTQGSLIHVPSGQFNRLGVDVTSGDMGDPLRLKLCDDA